jgi:hypothetical protein
MERQEAAPIMPSSIVTLRFNEGEYKGAALVGLIRDITADKIAVVLDGGLFSRGTSVQVQLDHGPRLEAWVRQCFTADGSSWLELSLNPADA